MKKFKALFIFTAYTIITALLLNTHALTAAEPAKKTIDTQNSKPQITPKNQKLDDLELENSNDLQKPQKKTTFVLDNEIKKFSYALGMEIGTSIKPMPAEFDKESLFKGIANVLDNESKLLTDEEAKNIKMKKFKKMREETNKKMSLAAEENKKLGKKFLSENIKNKNVNQLNPGFSILSLIRAKEIYPRLLPQLKFTIREHFLTVRYLTAAMKEASRLNFLLTGL
jgi:hypothetical protein